MVSMYAKIKFDREIDTDKHYISPGGYEMTFVNNLGGNPTTVCFDFTTYIGNVDKKEPTILHCEMEDLDVDVFHESLFIEHFLGTISEIKEFYVYTGEDDEPEINPVELLELRLSHGNYVIPADEKVLGKIWGKEDAHV
jgi:hypothetical protein